MSGPAFDAERPRKHGQAPTVGQDIGRYRLLHPLGAGGMATVYAAHDPQLRRTVALKILRHRGKAAANDRARIRLLREAQALAGLSHPNIVTVLDVGSHEGHVFLAMELVQGQNLAQWIQKQKRAWPDVVRVMIDAGRGLAAAHARGFVHRDFKPDNVMLGKDGRARVMDFGLVLATASDPRLDSHPDVEIEPAPGTDLALTRVGAAVGTPPYMAPEQHADGTVSPLSDQYSYCVTMYELLYRRRPFSGVSVDDFAAQKGRGLVLPAPTNAAVPAWLHRIVIRGLDPDPQGRFASMDALLDTLARGRQRSRRRRLAGGLVVGAVALAILPVVSAIQRRARTAACEAAGAAIAEIWNDASRTALVDALHASRAPHADATAARTTDLLDAYATGWQTTRTEICLDAKLRRRWDDEMHDRAAWCLDERRVALAVQIRAMTENDLAVAHQFVAAADALPSIAVCRDPEFVRRQPPPPSTRRDEVELLRAELVRAQALASARDLPPALNIARAALRTATALGWPPSLAEARLVLGHVLAETGEIAGAKEELTTAYYLARSLDMTGVAVDAASLLVRIEGRLLDHPDEAMAWARHAEASAQRLPGDGRPRRALLGARIAGVLATRGEHDEAMQRLEESLALHSESVGADHPSLGYLLDEMARIERLRGRYAEARQLIDRGLQIRIAALGPEHPDVLANRDGLARLLGETGEFAEARTIQEDLLVRRERGSGARSLDVARVLSNLAMTTYLQGDYAAATEYNRRSLTLHAEIHGRESTQYANELNTRAAIERRKGALHEAKRMFAEVLDIRERILGPEHVQVADAATNLADTLRATGELDAAEAMLERTLVTQRRLLGKQHRSVALTVHNLANMRLQNGKATQARVGFLEAIDLMEATIGPQHVWVAYPLTGLGLALLALEDPGAAIEPLERALLLRTEEQTAKSELRETRFALARALWASRGDRIRARALAEAALAEAAAEPSADSPIASEPTASQIEAWLLDHP